MKISNESEALESMDKLHRRGPKTVVISSSTLGGDEALIGYGSKVCGGFVWNVFGKVTMCFKQ